MHLYDLPLIFALIGLVLYTVLGGADFGAGMWQLTAGSSQEGVRIRDHAHDAIAPVWEANHVWLIFVLTVIWTAYPVAFGSIMSTLAIPMFLAGIGIVLRGFGYALRSGAQTAAEVRRVDLLFALSSILTPFALGATVGAIAGRRVPVGNATGHLVSSWLNGTSILIGAVAVFACAYLAAVYLAADAIRIGEPELADRFRLRALIAGTLAGALALAGIPVLHHGAHQLYHGLTTGGGVATLIVSFLAGLLAIALVYLGHYGYARYAAALAVAAIVLGWAVAQEPVLLPGLTIRQAAAPHDTLVLVIVVVLGGAVILFPSLALLFRLLLGGQLGHGYDAPAAIATPRDLVAATTARAVLPRVAVACFVVGGILLALTDAPALHAIGVILLLASITLGFAAVGPASLGAG